MPSFETLFVEISQVVFEILDFLCFLETVLRKNDFLAITQKVLGAHQILILLIESFHLSYI